MNRESMKRNNLNYIKLIAMVSATFFLCYILLFSGNVKIQVFNNSEYDIDSLEIDGNFYRIEKRKSIFIDDCRNLKIQADLPFGKPQGVIKNKLKDTMTYFYCGQGVKTVKSGSYKFDVEAFVDEKYFRLFWKEHK